MKSNLAYIDESTDIAVRTRSDKATGVSDADRKKARKQAMKSVAGFDVFDEQAERAALDAIIAKNREAVETFVSDRKAVREKLNASGVTPLAVVPLKSWERLLRNSGMFMLRPESDGTVRIASNAFDGLKEGKRVATWSGPKVDSDEAEGLAAKNWAAWLLRLFPLNTDAGNIGAQATLVLPVPPADVINTLLKLSRAGVPMKTAAVPEAISFKETIPELRRRETARREEEARRLEALRRDPIIYTEHGGVAAIVAQFGDFPIEKEVIDAVVAADDFIPEKPNQSAFGLTTLLPDQQYMQALQAQSLLMARTQQLLPSSWLLG